MSAHATTSITCFSGKMIPFKTWLVRKLLLLVHLTMNTRVYNFAHKKTSLPPPHLQCVTPLIPKGTSQAYP